MKVLDAEFQSVVLGGLTAASFSLTGSVPKERVRVFSGGELVGGRAPFKPVCSVATTRTLFSPQHSLKCDCGLVKYCTTGDSVQIIIVCAVTHLEERSD